MRSQAVATTRDAITGTGESFSSNGTFLKSGALNFSVSSAAAVSASFQTVDGTATSPTNYAGVTNVLAFAPGQGSSNVVLTIIDDTVVNTDRTLTLMLTNVASVPVGSATLGISNALVTIVNDDIDVQFSTNLFTVTESVGTATISVVRSGVTNVAVTVDYATANGTAIDGLDFNGVSGTLTFPVGVTNVTFNVPVIDNTVTNATKSLNLTLSNVAGTASTRLGVFSTATLSITDDDAAPAAGSLDTNFVATTDGGVFALAQHVNTNQANLVGKLVIGGSFSNVNGSAAVRLARLNIDSTLDTNFTATVNGQVRALAAQGDGNVIVGGVVSPIAAT